MKLYAFTEQGLKELLDQYATNIFMDIKNDSKEGRTIELNTLYPAFPEPIDLPEEEELNKIFPSTGLFNEKNNPAVYDMIANSFIQEGANHIIQIIKNGLK